MKRVLTAAQDFLVPMEITAFNKTRTKKTHKEREEEKN